MSPDFSRLFAAAPDLYLVLDPAFVIVAVTDAYARATMIRREDVLGRGIFDVFPDDPEDRQATGTANLRASLERVLRHGRPDTMAVQRYAVRRPVAEGGGFEERHWSPSNAPVLDERGQVAYIIHRVEDVTEFVRLEELGSEQTRLAQELEGRTGRMEAEIMRRAQEIHAANRELRELQTQLETRVRERTRDLEVAHENLRRNEEHLRQAQKMEAVGQLAGGIAHDFNNLLSVILSLAELLLDGFAPDDPRRGDVEQIRRAGERAAVLTRQLLAFGRQQVLEPKVIDLRDVLRGVLPMLRRLIAEDIELNLRLPDRLGRVRVDPSQVEQVIVNLVVNARDASVPGGKITLEAADVDLDERYLSEHAGARSGPHVMMAVSDTGAGMDRPTQARIFDPFFTTKERGRGTGLGLATVHGIVEQSGGWIWVYSEPGRGTVFKVYLPRTDEPPERVSQVARRTSELAGSETILLVEDEPQVRAVVATILRRYGYQVIETESPEEAVTCSFGAERLDLLLTDVIMPRMSGPEVATRVAARRPGIRVLFMSGYTDNAIVHHGVLDAGVILLQKPITPEALVRKVRDVLDGAALS